MLFSIGILMISSVILLIFDRNSRYTIFFVLMAAGSIFSLFSLVFHISVFGNYYFYTTNPFYVLDYRIYDWLIHRFRFPLSVVLRFMNIGLFLYQISNCLFALELHFCLRWYHPAKPAGIWLHRLVFIVPVITLLYCDPAVSNYFYICCHLHPAFYPLLINITIVYKALSLGIILLPIVDLLRYARVIHLPYLFKRIMALTFMLTAQHAAYVLLFYFSTYSISAEKVYRSGYWIFETQPISTHTVYFRIPVVTLFLMVGCLVVLLSFRLDLSMQPFLAKKIQRNLVMMNNTLEDTLHSHKNHLFTMHIYMEKLKKRSDVCDIPEVRKLDQMISDSLADTARLLDRMNEQAYRFKPTDRESTAGRRGACHL